MWAFPSIRQDPGRIGAACGLAAVQAVHACSSEGELFEDACDECKGGGGGGCCQSHLGPLWLPRAGSEHEDEEKEEDEDRKEEGEDAKPTADEGIWDDTYLSPIMQIPLMRGNEEEEEFGEEVGEKAMQVVREKAPTFARWIRMVTRRDITEDKNLWVCCEFARERDAPFPSSEA